MATITIKGSAVAVIGNLKELPGRVDLAIHGGLSRGLLYAVGVSQRQYLSGPRPQKLDIRTRRLRDSVVSEVDALAASSATAQTIIGRMGSNVPYAGFHEFGFHGTENVRAHTRVISTLDVTGAPIDERRRSRANKAGEVFFLESRTKASQRGNTAFTFTQNVRAHTRRINYDGRPFIKPALEDSSGVIQREVGKDLKAINPS